MDDDLTMWLRARLDEDERVAKACPVHTWMADSAWLVDMLDPLPSQRRERPPGWTPMITTEDIQHIATHDPARVLREVEAKRHRLNRHRPIKDPLDSDGYLAGDVCEHCAEPWPCPDLRDDLGVYAGRDGFRTEWKP